MGYMAGLCVAALLIGMPLGCAQEPKRQGRDLAKAGMVRTLPLEALGPQVVRITELGNGNAGFEVDGQRLTDGKSLVGYLRNQPVDRYADGLFVTFVEKAEGDDDLFSTLTAFCVKENLDLFARAPTGKAGPAHRATWIVHATDSKYGP